MRVTENMRLIASLRSLAENAARAQRLTDQASRGIVVSRPSDGAAIYSSIVRRGDRIARLESRLEVMERSAGDLRLAESALASAADIIVRARELAVQQADGGLFANERSDAAKEVALMRQQLVGIANSKGQRGYLFSGTATNTPAFDPAGNFQGTSQTMEIEYADNQRMATNIDGGAAFKTVDLFAALAQLEADLTADNAAGVRATIDLFEQGHRQLITARTDAGGRILRLESSVDVTSNAATKSLAEQHEEQEGDLAETVLRLQEAQTAYERSIAVTRQVLTIASAVERF